jgi:hypothetical protein
MDLSPSPVPSSSVVPQLLNLRRSPVLSSFTGPRTCLAHQSGSQFFCRSLVSEPTSFAGPPFVNGSTNLPRLPVRFPVPLLFTGPPLSSIVRRFVSPSSVIRSSISPRSASPFAHGSIDRSRSSFPTSSVPHRFRLPPVAHQFPVGAR